jgi:hypothetical protein
VSHRVTHVLDATEAPDPFDAGSKLVSVGRERSRLGNRIAPSPDESRISTARSSSAESVLTSIR